MPKLASSLLDRLAIGLSGLCLVHCVAGVAFVGLFAVSGQMLDHDVHVIGLMLALPLAMVALWRGQLVHRRRVIAALGACGIALMAASVFVAHGAPAEILASVLGVAMLGVAHLWNMRASVL